ncbi:RNA-binding signal recognition particle subunit srp14 [Apophysomyces ossiformis]|uniref:Signal recognition particle subunit SRP14 n=1 Tax=Apophysomyces ossiformis TaxID=679940 RepID=A0A8H7EM55_9FUNG|nr:RNA-binding signal recognition particle subunit srp14 [Apophysomyces ossiformis]
MKALDPLTFTVQLGQFYEKSKESGTVAVTMKRSKASSDSNLKLKLNVVTSRRLVRASKTKQTLPKGSEEAMKSGIATEDVRYPCLVRAVYKNQKISTMVAPDDFNKFQNAYGTIIKAYMDSLKKKERTKKNKKPKTSH